MNRFELIGRVARKDFGMVGANNQQRLSITIAIDKNNRKKIEEENKTLPQDQQKATADFVRCTGWSDLGKNINTYFEVGDMIYVQGHIQNSTPKIDENGKKIYQPDNYVIDRFEFLQSKKEREASRPAQNTAPQAAAPQQPYNAQRGGYAAAPQAPYMNPPQAAAPQAAAPQAAAPQAAPYIPPAPAAAQQSAPQYQQPAPAPQAAPQQYNAVPEYPTQQYGFVEVPEGGNPFSV